MVHGVGVDIVDIDRFRRALDDTPGLVERCFTAAERHYCLERRNSAQHFAARFAAKEAIAKALGSPLSWHDVEIVREGDGPARAELRGRAAKVAAGRTIHISLSHSGNLAVAVAVVDSDKPEEVT